MTIMVRLDGEVVATIGGSRVFLSPVALALPDGDPKLHLIILMCDFALVAVPEAYTNAEALRHAKKVLAPPV